MTLETMHIALDYVENIKFFNLIIAIHVKNSFESYFVLFL